MAITIIRNTSILLGCDPWHVRLDLSTTEASVRLRVARRNVVLDCTFVILARGLEALRFDSIPYDFDRCVESVRSAGRTKGAPCPNELRETALEALARWASGDR